MYAGIHPVVGIQPFNEVFIPDTTQRWPGGMVMDAVDPYFGFGRFMYLQSGGAIALPGRISRIVDETFIVEDYPNTANLGGSFLVNRQVHSAINTWGWFQFEGVSPVQVNATVARAVAIGMAAAGVAGTNAAGKQLLGVKVLESQTFAITKTNGVIANGDNRLFLSNVNGLFVGLAVTGSIAGIATGTITGIDPSGRFVTLSANSTATTTVPTVTFTYTGFGLLHLQDPFVQGAIT